MMERRACLQDGDGHLYCCHGCLEAAAFIRAGGWDTYYERRTTPAPRPDTHAVSAVAFDTPSFLNAHTRVDGTDRIAELQVNGLRCAACTWLVERALHALPGVADAHVSYGSGRLSVRWAPDEVPLSALATRVASLGYALAPSGTQRDDHQRLLPRFGLAAFAAGNVMLLAIATYLGWFGDMAERHARLFAYATLVLATPPTLWSAQPFFVGAWRGLRYRIATMDLPLALAIGALYAHGLWAFFAAREGYLDSLTMLIALLLGGRLVESSTRASASEAAATMLATAPATALRRVGDTREEVAASELRPGDVVWVPQGMRVPADGSVIDGEAAVDLSMLTGESEPSPVSVGDTVPAGALLHSGAVAVEVTHTGAATTLARMAEAVTHARDQRAPHQRWTDRIAPAFTIAVLVVATATALAWLALGDPDHAIEATIAVLVVACPCALALATPSAIAAGLGAAAKRGAWIRSADALLRLHQVDRLLIDKTGTLTQGRPVVTRAEPEVLRIAASLERWSAHPIARAIVAEARSKDLPLAHITNVQELPGVGINGIWDGHTIALRSSSTTEGVDLWIDDTCAGAIQVRDRVRDDARAVLGRTPVPIEILSGDSTQAVTRVALALGIADARGAMSPDDKQRAVADHERAGVRTAFAGDGLNDAPAIAAAHVGIAMHEGTDAAVAAADVVVFGASLRPINAALRAGRATVHTLRALAAFSLTYNVVAVAFAALGFINPLIAAIIMPLSSLTVIIGASTLHWRMNDEPRHHSAPAPPLDHHGEHLRVPLFARGEARPVP